jgi:hypothetical protein
MYDPHNPPLPSFDEPQPDPPKKNRALLIWAAIAALGAVLIVVMSCGLVAMFFVPSFSENFTERFTGPEEEVEVEPPPTAPQPDEGLVPDGPVMIEEDFEQPTARWDQSSARVADGGYVLRLDTSNTDSYGLFLGGVGISNVDMAVDVQQAAGNPTAEYGIRFRQSGPKDYLMFSISGSGYYRLVQRVAGDYEPLVPWTYDARINRGNDAVNRLRVVADGPDITAFINDAQVLEATDEGMASGQLTLGLQTFDQGDLAVRFDNIAGQAEDIELDENFSNPENVRWSIGGAQIVEAGGSGVYEMFTGGGLQSWQQPLPASSSEVENFVVEVEATLMDAGEGTAYGIIFGDGGSFDFYSLLILPETGTLVLVYNDPEAGQTPVSEPVQLDAIETGTNATNTIRLELRESHVITMTINGEELPPLSSALPVQEGMVGMIVVSGESGRVQVRFDNFYLEELADTVEGDPA